MQLLQPDATCFKKMRYNSKQREGRSPSFSFVLKLDRIRASWRDKALRCPAVNVFLVLHPQKTVKDFYFVIGLSYHFDSIKVEIYLHYDNIINFYCSCALFDILCSVCK